MDDRLIARLMELPADSKLDDSGSNIDLCTAANDELADQSAELRSCLLQTGLGAESNQDASHETDAKVV